MAASFLAGCASEREMSMDDLALMRPQLDSLWIRLERAMDGDTMTLRSLYTESATQFGIYRDVFSRPRSRH